MTPEGKVKARIKAVLKKYENLYYDMPVPSGYGKSGLDFHGCYNGRYFAIEAKAPGKEPTVLQRSVIRQILAAGGMCFVVSDDRELGILEAWLDLVRARK